MRRRFSAATLPRCPRCRRGLDIHDRCQACDLADRTCPKCRSVHDRPITESEPCLFCVDPVADTQPAPPIAAE